VARDEDLGSNAEFEHGAYRESLLILFRQTPNAVLGHIIAASFVVYALSPVIELERLVTWFVPLVLVAISRFFASRAFLAAWPIDDEQLPAWTRSLNVLSILQTTFWGLAAFMIWPDQLEYRAFLTAILLGIIAAGGVMLAIHRNSFVIYLLPIALPVLYQLLAEGGELEKVMAALILLYAGLLLVAIHRLANVYIEGLEVRLRMQALSRIDGLTSIANRRGFDEYLGEMWQNSQRSAQSLGLIIMDVDNFKDYNDLYGHPTGDDALRRTAALLDKVASRATDLGARIGGEEFAIIMPSTDLDGAKKIAEEVLKAFHEAKIPHEASPHKILTVSLGVAAEVPGRDQYLDEFIDTVDKALYRAKAHGKNCIESVE
jgi:diguanylate cyclase (GGDEF)-like protein